MSHAYHHAKSSSSENPESEEFKKHLELHQFLDQSKIILGNATHRSLLHHSEGALLTAQWAARKGWDKQEAYDTAIQHIKEDMGDIVPASAWEQEHPNKTWNIILKRSIQNTRDWLIKQGEHPEDCQKIIELLQQAPLLWINSAGTFLAEAALGTMGKGNKPIRTLAEKILRITAKMCRHPEEYPSFHNVASSMETKEWMFNNAAKISEKGE